MIQIISSNHSATIIGDGNYSSITYHIYLFLGVAQTISSIQVHICRV